MGFFNQKPKSEPNGSYEENYDKFNKMASDYAREKEYNEIGSYSASTTKQTSHYFNSSKINLSQLAKEPQTPANSEKSSTEYSYDFEKANAEARAAAHQKNINDLQSNIGYAPTANNKAQKEQIRLDELKQDFNRAFSDESYRPAKTTQVAKTNNSPHKKSYFSK